MNLTSKNEGDVPMNTPVANLIRAIASTFRWLLCPPFLALFLAAPSAIGSTFTVQDIIDGIEARRSKVKNIELQYLVTTQNYDALYEKRAKMAERRKKVNPDLNNLEDPPRTSAYAYHLIVQGNKIAYETFSVTPYGTRSLGAKAGYDGQILKALNLPEKNGVIRRASPESVVVFPTLAKLLGINKTDLYAYLKQPGIEAFITDERIDDGDFIVKLVLRNTYLPAPVNHPSDIIVTEYRFDINTQKDFWPQNIEYHVDATLRGDKWTSLMSKTTAAGFVQKSGLYIPTQIETNEFDTPDGPDEPKLLTNQTVKIEKVEVNQQFSDDVFDLEFPEGTGYYDAIAGVGMTVGEPPDFLAEIMRESLPSSEGQPLQSPRILKNQRGKDANTTNRALPTEKGKPDVNSPPIGTFASGEAPANRLGALAYLLLALFCAFAGYLTIKMLKKKAQSQ